MAPCPTCGTEMTFYSQNNQWYCNSCQQYSDYHSQDQGKGHMASADVQEPASKKKNRMIVLAVVIVVVLVILPILFLGLGYLWDSDQNGPGIGVDPDFYPSDESGPLFPTVDMDLIDDEDGDKLTVKHIVGDPLNWSRFRMEITETYDDSKKALLNDLSSLGTIDTPETSTIDPSIPGFDSIDYVKDTSYHIEVYNIEENVKVFEIKKCKCQ